MRNLRLVPQPGLSEPDGGLLVSWTPGDGDVDMYIVSLSATVGFSSSVISITRFLNSSSWFLMICFDADISPSLYIVVVSVLQDGVAVDTRPVPKHVSSLDFLDLIPGHAYTVTIQSVSGKLTNRNTAVGRAGETQPWISRRDSDLTRHDPVPSCSSSHRHRPAGR